MSQRTPRKISKAEVRNSIDSGIAANDMIRAGGLGKLLQVRGKKAGLQQREQQRLNAKYGSEHPRVQQVNRGLEANATYIGGLRMETTRANAPRVKPDADAWCVQGYVYDRDGCPIADASVALFSIDGKPVPVVEAGSTNDKGYYRLDYKSDGTIPPAGDQVLDQSGDSVLAGAGDTAAGANAGSAGDPAASGGIRTNLGATAGGGAETTGGGERLSEGLRINVNANTRASVFVRANDPVDADICSDSTLITPRVGVCSYRDLVLDTGARKPAGSKDRRATRYLGNSATRELHDLKNEQPRCQIDAIRFDHCFNFNTQKQAVAAGYDFCAYCFGKEKSKR